MIIKLFVFVFLIGRDGRSSYCPLRRPRVKVRLLAFVKSRISFNVMSVFPIHYVTDSFLSTQTCLVNKCHHRAEGSETLKCTPSGTP